MWRGVGQLLDLAAIDGLHDRVAGREVPVKRADPDARAARDLVELASGPTPRTPPWPPRADRRGCAGRRRGAYDCRAALAARRFPAARAAGATCDVGAQISRVLLLNGGSLRISNGGILRLFLLRAPRQLSAAPKRRGPPLIEPGDNHVQILCRRIHHRRGAGRRKV